MWSRILTQQIQDQGALPGRLFWCQQTFYFVLDYLSIIIKYDPHVFFLKKAKVEIVWHKASMTDFSNICVVQHEYLAPAAFLEN